MTDNIEATTLKYSGIPYEALGEDGPYIRSARVIHELPTPERRLAACAKAADAVGKLLGVVAKRSIPFGPPVYLAFGMTRPDAKSHAQSALLLTHGCDLPLTFCN